MPSRKKQLEPQRPPEVQSLRRPSLAGARL